MATNNVVFTGNSTAQYQSLYLELNIKSQDTTKLTTTFSYKAWIIGNTSGSSGSTSNGSVTLSNAYSKSLSGQSWSWNNTTSQIIAQGEFTKTHASDGSLSTQTLTCKANIATYSGIITATVSAAVTPAKIAVDKPSVYMGTKTMELGTSYVLSVNQTSGYTHDFYYNINGGVEIAKDVVSQISWTPSISIAEQIVNSTQIGAKLTVVTKKNGIVIGSNVTDITFVVPSNIVPSVSILSISDTATAQFTKFGFYIQGKSYPKVTSTSAGSYGSTIKSITVEYDGRKYYGSSVAIGVTGISGTQTVKVTVTDSRGRVAVASQTIKVVAYSNPTINSFSAERCNSDGTPNPTGANIKVTYSVSVTSLENKNNNSIKIRYKKQSESTYTERAITTSTYSTTGSVVLTGIDTNSRYDVLIEAADYFAKESAYSGVSTAEVFFDVWGGEGVGITFGEVAQGPGFFIGQAPIATRAVRIADNVDLNNFTDEGTWYAPSSNTAKTISNVPEAVAFNLQVIKNAGITQIFTSYYSKPIKQYIRNYYTEWGDWYEILNSSNNSFFAPYIQLTGTGTAADIMKAKWTTAEVPLGIPFIVKITISGGSVAMAIGMKTVDGASGWGFFQLMGYSYSAPEYWLFKGGTWSK